MRIAVVAYRCDRMAARRFADHGLEPYTMPPPASQPTSRHPALVLPAMPTQAVRLRRSAGSVTSRRRRRSTGRYPKDSLIVGGQADASNGSRAERRPSSRRQPKGFVGGTAKLQSARRQWVLGRRCRPARVGFDAPAHQAPIWRLSPSFPPAPYPSRSRNLALARYRAPRRLGYHAGRVGQADLRDGRRLRPSAERLERRLNRSSCHLPRTYCGAGSTSATQVGWTAGAGVEYAHQPSAGRSRPNISITHLGTASLFMPDLLGRVPRQFQTHTVDSTAISRAAA